ncbi:MAG: hypothetical protein ABII64_08385 [Elusimicrobiota bacterium]
MKRKTVEIYALVVCFTAICAFMVSLGIGTYGLVKVVKPSLTINAWTYKMFQDNQSFRDQKLHESTNKDKKPLSEEKVTAMRLSGWASELGAERRKGFQNFVQCAIFVVIAIVVFLFHWKLAKREKAA